MLNNSYSRVPPTESVMYPISFFFHRFIQSIQILNQQSHHLAFQLQGTKQCSPFIVQIIIFIKIHEFIIDTPELNHEASFGVSFVALKSDLCLILLPYFQYQM